MDIEKKLELIASGHSTGLGRDWQVAAINKAREEILQLRELVRSMIENDPDDIAADGITVLDAWRQRAIEILVTYD